MTTRSILPVLPTTWKPLLTGGVAIALSALLASCAALLPSKPSPEPAPEPAVVEKKPPPKPIKPPPPSRLYQWNGSDDYVSRIEISINEQKARFYNGDKEVGWTTVASGLYKRPTPVGSFAVLEKVQNKRSNLYGRIYNKNGKLVKRNANMYVDSVPAGGRFVGASMPFFLRLTNDGIGMHAGPIPHPGRRASHGCIRMPKKFAPILYRYVSVGTPVTIKGKGPTYASYLKKQRKSAPKPRPAPAAAPQPESAVASVQKPASPAPGQSPGTPQPAAAPDGSAAASGSAGAATLATAVATTSTPSVDVAAVPETTSSDQSVPLPTAAPTATGSAPTSPEAASSVPGGREQKPVAEAVPPAAVSQEAQVKPPAVVPVPSAESAKGGTAPASAGGSETGENAAPAEAAATPAEAPVTQSSEG
jgi:lipoprotein-anchoring transpeptidase ErfK/SrfK